MKRRGWGRLVACGLACAGTGAKASGQAPDLNPQVPAAVSAGDVFAAPPIVPSADARRTKAVPSVYLQPPAGGDDIPTLPRTVVEAEAPAAAPPPPNPTPPVPQPPTPPGLSTANDSPFASALSSSQGYNATTSTTGTIVDTPLIDYAGSVQVVTPELMRDQGARTLDDLVRNVPGLNLQTNGGGRQEIWFLRGFNILANQFRKDGFRDAARTARDMANVERVEILKGPAGVLYGSGDAAGTVNLITKKPLAEAYSSIQYQGGSFDFNRATLDTTGPVDEGGDLLYRLNVAGQMSNSFRDFVFADRGFIAPAFTYRVDSDTLVTVQGDYLYDDRIMDRGIAAINGQLGAIPITRFLGEPDDKGRFWDGQVNIVIDHRIDDDWAWQAGWVSNFSKELRQNADNRTLVGTTMRRAYVVQDTTYEQDHFFRGNLVGTIGEDRFVSHKLVVGTELGYDDFDNRSANAGGTAGVPFWFDVFNPVYGQPRPTLPALASSYSKNELYGLYFQDIIAVGEHWNVMVGLRHDNSVRYSRAANGARSYFSEDALTQRYGVVYQPLPEEVAFYATYAESFNPLNGQTFDNDPFVPETGQLYETGIKIDAGDYLSFTVAGFDIRKQNTTVPDPINAGFSVQRGEVTSKGCEALCFAQLTENWTMLANCAYIDARVTADTNPANVGLRVVSVPYFTSGLWTRYDLIRTDERTVGFGLGYNHVGNREGTGTRANAFNLPEYELWNLAFYYSRGPWDFQVNIENVLDVEYYVGSQNQNNVTPGAPTTALATIRWTY